jgi:hypothetical protein
MACIAVSVGLFGFLFTGVGPPIENQADDWGQQAREGGSCQLLRMVWWRADPF